MIVLCFSKQTRVHIPVEERIDDLERAEKTFKPYNIEFEKRVYNSSRYEYVKTGLEQVPLGVLKKKRQEWYKLRAELTELRKNYEKVIKHRNTHMLAHQNHNVQSHPTLFTTHNAKHPTSYNEAVYLNTRNC